jgi:type II restriction enzyme
LAKITAADIVDAIARLDRNRVYNYATERSKLRIVEITKPEGPITFVRINNDGSTGSFGSISREQLAKMALICSSKPNFPLHIDRVFSAGGNSRSAFETLLAHTPNFFICYPQ